MKYYVVSDIHSYYTPLMTALTEKGFFDTSTPNTEKKLIVLGDAFDRGEDTVKVAEFLLKLHKENRLIYITGNHEDLLYQCIQMICQGRIYEIACGMSHHYTNGTFNTLLHLGGMDIREAANYPDLLIKNVKDTSCYRELLPATVDYFEAGSYIFCHGWIPSTEKYRGRKTDYVYYSDWRNSDTFWWRAARWYNGMDLACNHKVIEPEKTIICGHWHTSWGHCHIDNTCSEYGEDADYSPFFAKGIIAVDACTARTQKVNCIIIDV